MRAHNSECSLRQAGGRLARGQCTLAPRPKGWLVFSWLVSSGKQALQASNPRWILEEPVDPSGTCGGVDG